MKRYQTLLFHGGALALLTFFLWQTGEVGANASATADEPIYIRSGILLLHEGDRSINDISSPFLVKMLNAIPLMGLEGAVPAAVEREEAPGTEKWPPLLRQWWAGTDLVRSLNPKTVLPLGRLVPRIFGLATGLLIYLVLGGLSGLLALAIYVFLPEAAAHASLATLESGLAFFTLLTLVLLFRFLKEPGWRFAVFTGLSLGAALLAKTTGVVLALFIALVFLVRLIRVREGRGRMALNFLVLAVSAWFLLNAAFSFEGTFDALADQPEYRKIETRLITLAAPLSESLQWGARNLPLLIPSSYLHTLLTQAQIAGKGKLIFFNGAYSESGWAWLMGLTFLIKMPIGFLLLIIVGTVFMAARRELRVYGGFALFLLLFFSFASRLNAGVRYLLPALPGLCLLGGAAIAVLFKERWYFGALALGPLLWLAAADVWVHPHQLSYANELAGGPQNLHKLLADSNVDWGQDLPALKGLMDREGIEEVRLSYFGSDDPEAYGLRFEALPSVGLKPQPGEAWWFEEDYRERFELKPGVYALSANNLHGLYFQKRDLFALFRKREPDFLAGYSILVYDLR
jgi:4-amino-4-deoxy-L-arabinose transferase-like glycosyltransferase